MTEALKFTSLRDDKLASELLFRLIAMDGKGNIVSFGTAFALHPYLLVTAKHVLDEFAKQSGGGWVNGEIVLTFWAAQIEWRNVEHQYNIWLVTHAFSGSFGDIALLKISPLNKEASEYKAWKLPKVNLKLPREGDDVVGFGFHEMTFEGSRLTSEGLFEHIQMDSEVSATQGSILQVYPDKRDSVMLPFPVARVNARFEPGMSGGPVLNRRSELCGVVCSSMKIGDEYESYIALLWPMVGIPIDFDTYVDSPVKGYKPLFELIKSGYWAPRGLSHVNVSWVDQMNQWKIDYLP